MKKVSQIWFKSTCFIINKYKDGVINTCLDQNLSKSKMCGSHFCISGFHQFFILNSRIYHGSYKKGQACV